MQRVENTQPGFVAQATVNLYQRHMAGLVYTGTGIYQAELNAQTVTLTGADEPCKPPMPPPPAWSPGAGIQDCANICSAPNNVELSLVFWMNRLLSSDFGVF